jgi:hypothetical protein
MYATRAAFVRSVLAAHTAPCDTSARGLGLPLDRVLCEFGARSKNMRTPWARHLQQVGFKLVGLLDPYKDGDVLVISARSKRPKDRHTLPRCGRAFVRHGNVWIFSNTDNVHDLVKGNMASIWRLPI